MDQNNSNNNNNSNSNSNNNNNDRIDNRLVFPDKFLGRQDELNTLMELYRGVCAKRDGSSGHAHGTPLVLIGGYSGVGKSHLVKQFCKSIAREAEKQQQPQPQQPPQHYFSSNSNSNRSSSNSNSSSNRSNSIINGNSNSKNRKKRIKPCYFLSGKYDETISADPFSGIVQAFNGFCQTLLEGDAEELERMRNIIQKAVGDEGKVVTDVVPNLIKIIGEQQQPQQQQPQTQQGNSNTSNNSIHVNNSNNNNNQYTQNSKKDFDWNRLLYVFKNFVSGISSSGNPLVLFLDDVQWIDEASMDLVFDLVQNKTENLMLLGSYRSNEMDDDHPMSIRLSKLEDEYNDTNNSNSNISDTNNTNTTTNNNTNNNNSNTLSKRIELDNLSLEHVSEFIAATLRLDVEEVASLAEVVYSKTHGNIYFTEQTLEDLQRKQVLYKSLSTFQWTWNMEIIEQVVGMSANVVDMVTSKLSALPELLQKTLAVAAYMKNTFDRETLLSVLLEAEGYENIDADMLDRLLEVAVEEGLLMEHLNFQFTHDRIKQAARELIPEGKKQNAFRVRLGKHLVTLADSQQGEDWMLFVAADHLNAVTKNDMSPLEVATLNLNVGEKAVSTAAFIAALKYLKIGMEALHHMESPWENHYHLALGLHRATANVELCFGDFDKGQALCLTLIEKTPSVREQLRIKLNLADALGQMERHKEAMNIHLDALYSIKGFPRRFLLPRALREFSLVKNLLKKYADHEICALPPMADENTLSAMEHLSSLALRSFMCGNEIGTLVCVLRMIQTTFRCGLCAESAQGFAYFGQIMSATGGILVAKRLATLACQVLEKVYGIDRVRAKNRESIVLSINAIYVDAYAVPIPQILESLQHAHKSGMESGDLESVSILDHSVFVVSCGVSCLWR
jgi:predicted ATPase